MRRIAFSFAMILFGAVFAQAEAAQDLLDEFWQLRMRISTFEEGDSSAIDEIDNFFEANAEKISRLDEQEQLSFENLRIMETFNCMGGIPGENDEERGVFETQWKKTKKLYNATKASARNKYLCLTYSDITTYYVCYSIFDILWHGRSIRSVYEEAVKLDKDFSCAMLNIGGWCYHAPKIFGGGKQKAAEWYEKAARCARNDAEKYFAAIALSQVLFELKDFENSKKWLEVAAEACPESKTVALIREQNAVGRSFNDYQKSKSKLLRDADKYREKQGWD